MNYLSVDQLSKSFGERTLFENISFGLSQGQKIALVGVNGSGKSTLLKILAGIDSPDRGQVVINSEVKLAYLGQQPDFEPDLTILEAILAGDDAVSQLIKKYEYHVARVDTDAESAEKLTVLIEQMEEADAWNYESQLKEILGKVGIHNLEQKIGELSGGQKKRVGLAKTLIEKPDLIILDEPTNHLDLAAIEWLENYFSSSQLALIMVTHDRYFLDNVTTEIIELENEGLYHYQGNYAYFLEKKTEREQNAQIEKDKARSQYKKELEWIRRQPKARGTKAKYRVEAFDDIKKRAHVNLEKSDVVLQVSDRRQGGKIVELEKVTKAFNGQQVIQSFSYIFKKGEKIGIVGENGSGKSTFLNLINQKIMPDSGEVILGQTTLIGYYEQKEPDFQAGLKVIDVVKEIAEIVSLSDGSTVSASKFLTLFNFSVKAQYDYVDKLSGGEKRRLQLLLVLIRNPNFLILDEPTNDLDLITLRVLEDFLAGFKGCVIIVSHDRYFMDRLVEQLFVFEKGKAIRPFTGNYSDYRQAERHSTEKTVVEATREVKERVKTEARKMSFKEKRELEEIEKELETINGEKERLIIMLNSGEGDHALLAQWGKELKMLEDKIDTKEMRWLELSELE
ncbi:ABC-F family ATP-binding cassette domain-containing protein [Fulvivirga sp. M361]|uniref:ABC-F family ATP-binding cassette domain-containing protein n=1 Tax=Fulvivirga sp. M361 TaxID=2594266 RepID=UPI00117A1366|nr:ABC-F family ATP-binding cassette domain-containing protein [Fulvivirga sp. M361]TRX49213.1 ABC-F family ATP-binding cassette domain-containing protein [Fulvivirga sp. M361]